MIVSLFRASCLLWAQCGILLLGTIATTTGVGVIMTALQSSQWGLYDFEMIELLTPVIVSLMLPYVHLQGHHISWLPLRSLPSRWLRLRELIIGVLLALFYAILAFRSGIGSQKFYEAQEVTIVLGWQRWWGSALVTVMLAWTAAACWVRGFAFWWRGQRGAGVAQEKR